MSFLSAPAPRVGRGRAPPAPATYERIIAGFREWREKLMWNSWQPINEEHLARMPSCIVYYTTALEAQSWKQEDPEQQYWQMENWLSEYPF